MITPVQMPQLGLEVNEGTVSALLVEVGAVVDVGTPLIELETDKAVTEVVAPRAGVVRSIVVAPGETVEVGATLLQLADEHDELLVATTASVDAADPQFDLPVAPMPGASEGASTEVASHLRVAPIARRAAVELGVDLARVRGTGPRGRITLDDVEAASAANQTTPKAAEGSAVPRIRELSSLRRAIARRMIASQLIPQFTLAKDVDATYLRSTKELLVAKGSMDVNFNDLFVQAIAEIVLRHPTLRTQFVESETSPTLVERDEVDVGLAVASDRGLLVPVIRRVHQRGLVEIAGERSRLVARARAGRLAIADSAGATITLSSLAGFGVDHFGAMVIPGESAIVALGQTTDRVVPRDSTIAIVPMMTISMTFDHRAIDGAVGATALADFAELLEGKMAWRP